ncbi:ABC transporter ATP-binding protein [Phytoactinopolyspora endophytica]|uniref:ABC transporter ATP-binding protein n=1 Tax=Phytoactinopolyspora endophytica TaxID=1642495 RepID=UPI00101CFE10|nr:ABC transporter ATP-binding protein [Phytoactinopolyspora endophytica]
MLEIRGLDAFYGDAQALWGIGLDVAEGEIISVVGPNGAGKSTLVQAIAGLQRSVRGRILLDGVDLTSVAPHRVCEYGVATVPEGRRVFPDMSVYDNLCLGAYRKAVRGRHQEALAAVHDLFPVLADRSTQPAATLSGGEQQMLAIGRALMARPRLLLTDEPSLGLAPVVVDEVFDVIQSINADGVSVLLVEQDVERALAMSSRGYLLGEGRIVTTGTSDELRSSADVRRSVLGL